MVVACGGFRSASIHPWFEDAVIPVRVHRAFHPAPTNPEGTPTNPGAGLSRHRFESWVRAADGSLQFSGCRWAEGPELGAGVTDPTERSNAVAMAQDSFVETHLSQETSPDTISRAAGIVAFTCDGLPLVGPLPGAPRVLAMTGWGGWGLSAIGAAVEDLANAILGTESPHQSPRSLLSPRRML